MNAKNANGLIARLAMLEMDTVDRLTYTPRRSFPFIRVDRRIQSPLLA